MNQETSTPTDSASNHWVHVFLSQFIAAGAMTDTPPAVMQQVSFDVLMNAITNAKLSRTHPMVLHLYRQWIIANISSNSPQMFIAWYNLAIGLVEAGDFTNAIVAYQSALQIKPNFYWAANGLGALYERLGHTDKALAVWESTLPPQDIHLTLLNNRGRVLCNIRRYKDAETCLRSSLAMDPSQVDIASLLSFSWQSMCQWDDIKTNVMNYGDNVPAVIHFGGLALFDDITTQRRIAEVWINRLAPPAPTFLSPPEGYNHKKIRIGYMSADFIDFPMSFLIAELFERHDREQFEVYGYCNSWEDGSDTRKRVIASFDHFHRIRGESDEAAARLIREHEIDILIDLNGLTGGGRERLLRWKPAPVQITYLGYIGPIPLPELDYILCDDYVIPPDVAHLYQPKPLYLDGLYQVNDTKLPIAPPTTRQAIGLPVDKFIYCCLVVHYKITGQVFDAWMEILKRNDNSVLWLYDDSTISKENMRKEAAKRGIDPDRLIFSQKVPHPEYMSRLALADLFLDTAPYNTGTVASEALRMNVPLLTVEGKTFAGRMAGSLLMAIGLSDLIAPDLPGYVECAVELGKDPQKWQRYKDVLLSGAWGRTLGNIQDTTARIEKVYRTVVKRSA